MVRFAIFGVAAMTLGGCAKGADKVLPVAVPTLEYERMGCADLATVRMRNMEMITARYYDATATTGAAE